MQAMYGNVVVKQVFLFLFCFLGGFAVLARFPHARQVLCPRLLCATLVELRAQTSAPDDPLRAGGGARRALTGGHVGVDDQALRRAGTSCSCASGSYERQIREQNLERGKLQQLV